MQAACCELHDPVLATHQRRHHLRLQLTRRIPVAEQTEHTPPAGEDFSLVRHKRRVIPPSRNLYDPVDGLGPESLQAFVDVCRGVDGVFNGCDAVVGARAVAVIDAMYRSAAENAVVELHT